jgi:hypothetical protein
MTERPSGHRAESGESGQSCFVSYDLRAIHSFIFRVPKLKYIVGGSAIVDAFDREFGHELAQEFKDLGVTRIYGGGGKGVFHCSTREGADRLMTALVDRAHQLGLDIRLGKADTFEGAASNADQLFSYMPDANEGEPCAMSGLYPVVGGGTHATIKARVNRIAHGEPMHRHFEDRVGNEAAHLRALFGTPWRFLSHVADEGEADPEGVAGLAALGGRGRWAIIYMDGNDMGRQFAAARDQGSGDPDWVAAMSGALDRCSLRAVIRGFEHVAAQWHSHLTQHERDACVFNGETIVPFRPLVVGGDDIVVICHARYAFDFVQRACDAWYTASNEAAGGYSPAKLWPATGGFTTVSAGVLFCPVNMPLHAAVPYAETLLRSAKDGGRAAMRRGTDVSKSPSPACIDWESVTESVLDHPAHRRRRELEFLDGDDGDARIMLTRRPYTMDAFVGLHDAATNGWLAKLPRSIRSQVLPSLRQAKHDRMLDALSLRGRHGNLADILEGGGEQPLAWHARDDMRTVGLADAVSILEELSRADDGRGQGGGA